MDYPEEVRNEVLDWLFKPGYDAAFHHLKVEIGGDVNSTDGTEPAYAHTREEFDNPDPAKFSRGYESWLMTEARKRNPSKGRISYTFQKDCIYTLTTVDHSAVSAVRPVTAAKSFPLPYLDEIRRNPEILKIFPELKEILSGEPNPKNLSLVVYRDGNYYICRVRLRLARSGV